MKISEETGENISNTDYILTSVNMFVSSIKVGDLVVVSDGNHKFRAIAEVTGDYEFLDDEGAYFQQMRTVKWLRVYEPSLPMDRLFDKALSQMTIYELKEPTLNEQKLEKLLFPNGEDHQKPFVLIVDEINRGNISKIFGELITLIEEDKRIGAEYEMTVRLPMSVNEIFGVPKNLHIIGTMNTADRSIAMMDTALRRRFEFKEMMPNPCLLHVDNLHEYLVENFDSCQEDWEDSDNWDFSNQDKHWSWDVDYEEEDLLISKDKEGEINLRRMLHAMNQRIEVLYDREHTIGHAYFMNLNNKSIIDDLASIFEHKVIPLLSEYFFEDWEKIRMVLGDDQKGNAGFEFITVKKANDAKGLFSNQTKNDYLDGRNIYTRNKKALGKADSYIKIYDMDSTKKSQDKTNENAAGD